MLIDSKQLLRDALVGFVIGLVVTAGIGWGVSVASAQQATGATSAE